MKLVTSMIITGLAMSSPITVLAAKGGEKGPADQAYERANENANFKRNGDDWMKNMDKDDKDLKNLDKQDKKKAKDKAKDLSGDLEIDDKDLNKIKNKAKKYGK